jgi:hypothetical protein
MLFCPKRGRRPGPKGPKKELIDARRGKPLTAGPNYGEAQ